MKNKSSLKEIDWLNWEMYQSRIEWGFFNYDGTFYDSDKNKILAAEKIMPVIIEAISFNEGIEKEKIFNDIKRKFNIK